jgi:hypothetical protein
MLRTNLLLPSSGKLEEASSSGTSLNVYQATWREISENNIIFIHSKTLGRLNTSIWFWTFSVVWCWLGVLSGLQNSQTKSITSRAHNFVYTNSYIYRTVNTINIWVSLCCFSFNKNITTLCSEAASLLAQMGDSVGGFNGQTVAREAGIQTSRQWGFARGAGI